MGKPFRAAKEWCQKCGTYIVLGRCPVCTEWGVALPSSRPIDATMPAPISPEASNLANLISSLTGFTGAQEYRVAEAIEAGLRAQREMGLR